MDGCCKPSCKGMKMVVFGLILIANQLWFRWDIWVVVGALVALKGVMCMAMPCCPCQKGMCDMKEGKKGKH